MGYSPIPGHRGDVDVACFRSRPARILGGGAARLFKPPPRNEKQKENLIDHGNLAA
jgi:hypothetical protein